MKRLLLLFLLLLPVQAFAAWSVTNDKQIFCGGFINSCADSPFDANLTNNSTIIVTVRQSLSTTTIYGCTDTATNVYVDTGLDIDVGIIGATANILHVLIAHNTHTTASNVVTCTVISGAGSSGTMGIDATEVTGGSQTIDASITVATTSAGGGANAFVFPSYSPTKDGDFIYVAALCGPCSGFTAGTSPIAFTLMPGTINAMITEYYIQPTHGAIAPTIGYVGGSANWGGLSFALQVSAVTATATQIGAFAVGP